jgi:small subunit ribosomal protein S16
VAVRIRLTRTGRKNLPSYRIGVFDEHTRRDGPAIEILGWFNPLSKDAGKGFRVEAERLREWVGKGALPTLPLQQLLKRQGVTWEEEGAAKRRDERKRKKSKRRSRKAAAAGTKKSKG